MSCCLCSLTPVIFFIQVDQRYQMFSDHKQEPFSGRKKSNSLKQSILMKKKTSQQQKLSNLSFLDLPIRTKKTVQKRLTTDSVLQYILNATDKIYTDDVIGYRWALHQYFQAKQVKLKHKIQQRLSLQTYLQESLLYKSFAEIEAEIESEWNKNLAFSCVNKLWVERMLIHEFKTVEEFIQQYECQRNLITNISYFYFLTSLRILNNKNSNTFSNIYQSCSHNIINSTSKWANLYETKLIGLLKNKKINNQEEINFEFNLATLNINDQYIDIEEKDNQLPETTELILNFAEEKVIRKKILLLKQIRASFLKEIQDNRQKIADKKHFKKIATLQKDDIIGCMIYCIIKGQPNKLQSSLKALSLLLGKTSQLLSQKGVDCYRADLQSAVQYLCEQRLNSPLIMIPGTSMPKQQIKV